MRQRIVIAICLALNPKLLIMDEPTTALDVVVQREILQRIHKLREELGFSVLFITHDLALMVQVSDRIGIMLEGELVEVNDAQAIYRSPQPRLHAAALGLDAAPARASRSRRTLSNERYGAHPRPRQRLEGLRPGRRLASMPRARFRLPFIPAAPLPSSASPGRARPRLPA